MEEDEADDKHGSNGKHTKVVYPMFMGALRVSGRHVGWEFKLVTWVQRGVMRFKS